MTSRHLFTVLLLLAAPVSAWPQKFDQVRRDVRSGNDDDEERDEKRTRRNRRYPYSDCRDDDEESFLGALLGSLFSSSGGGNVPAPPPFDPSMEHWRNGSYQSYAPPAQAPLAQPAAYAPSDAPLGEKVGQYFSHYPYADGHTGYLFFDEDKFRPEDQGASVWFEYGTDFETLDRWTGKLLWERTVGWNFDAEWSVLRESLGTGGQDLLHLGDVNVLTRLLAMENMQWFVGAGLNWLADHSSADFGFNLTGRVNTFPVRPFILTAEVDYGWLGSTDQFHAVLGAGAIWNHFELFAGYDYRRLGSVEFIGPSFGVRYWW